jgi:hypothetical protein
MKSVVIDFDHCQTPQKVYEELHNQADMASSEDEVLFLNQRANARIKELQCKN